MCCSEGGCGFTPQFITVGSPAIRTIRSLRVPLRLDIEVIIRTDDTPPVIFDTGADGLSEAEIEIVRDIFAREDRSPDLSSALQRMRTANGGITLSNREVVDPAANNPADFGGAEVDELNGVLQPGSTPISIVRENIMRAAEAWGSTYNEVFAEVVIHEIFHPGLGVRNSAHKPILGVGPSPDTFFDTYGHRGNGTTIGKAQRRAYKDLYDKEPPGYLFTTGGSTSPPTELNQIRNDPEFGEFYQGILETLNATIAYPDYKVRWEGNSQ